MVGFLWGLCLLMCSLNVVSVSLKCHIPIHVYPSIFFTEVFINLAKQKNLRVLWLCLKKSNDLAAACKNTLFYEGSFCGLWYRILSLLVIHLWFTEAAWRNCEPSTNWTQRLSMNDCIVEMWLLKGFIQIRKCKFSVLLLLQYLFMIHYNAVPVDSFI